MRKIDGRKAEVVDAGERYDTYTTFAEKYDYPDAAHDWHGGFRDRRTTLKKGDVVTLLTSATHIERPQEGTLWIVEAANGERHIYNEKGLRILSEELSGITVLSDESLGGIQREYREVKRKAAVGERIKIVNNGAGHDLAIGYICTADNEDFAEGWALYHAEERAEPDYVVLEKTEVIRIDNERLHMVDRKAAVGERVIVKRDKTFFKKGEIFTVEDTDWAAPAVGLLNGYNVIDGDYYVLEPIKSAKPAPTTPPLSAQPPVDQIAANFSTLLSQVMALEKRVSALEGAKKVASGPVDDALPSFANMPRAKSRDEIVERAKSDVSDLLAIGRDDDRFLPGDSRFHGTWFGVDFVVSREKRSVTALIFKLNGFTCRRTSAKPAAVGRAKCAPNDVFNAHIGRAISLRRALGLEVPAEYLSVPNPEEPRVGDVVDDKDFGVDVVTAIRPAGYMSANEGLTTTNHWTFIHHVKIIDDSREGVAK